MSDRLEKATPSSAPKDSSAALLADAQDTRISLNLKSVQTPDNSFRGPASVNPSEPVTAALELNDKLTDVNAKSASDRNSWLKDFSKANSDPRLTAKAWEGASATAMETASVGTGADGKANSFAINMKNYNDDGSTTASAVLAGNVGKNGPENLHFDASKTSAQFASNEALGTSNAFNYWSAQGSDREPQPELQKRQLAEFGAVAQAMPADLRDSMIKQEQQLLPNVKFNTDASGNLTSINFNNQTIAAADFDKVLKADSGKIGATPDDIDSFRKAETAPPAKSDDSGYSVTGSSGVPLSAYGGGSHQGSGGSNQGSGLRNGETMQGVGADGGQYEYDKFSGTVSKIPGT